MIPNRYPAVAGTLILILVLISTASGPALAASELVVTPEVKRLIDEESIEAAKARYQELSQSGSFDFPLETQGLQTLLLAYLQAGRQEAAEAVGEIMSDMAMNMVPTLLNQSMPPGMAQQMEAQRRSEQQAKAQRQQEQQAEQRLREEKLAEQRGQSRNDLSRFSGHYGELGVSDIGRTIFVSVSCDGYLVTGPMWADISPWWMYSDSEFVFTYSFRELDFSMLFETDGAGRIVRMRHGIDGVKSPLEWKQALSEEWSECVERMY